MKNKSKTIIATLMLLLCIIPAFSAKGDEFCKGSNYDNLCGGWVATKNGLGKHWTSYQLKQGSNQVVTAIIRINGVAESKSGNGYAKITSAKEAGPYVSHTHSYTAG